MSYQPRPPRQQPTRAHYRRRRIAAVIVAILFLAAIAGAGAVAENKLGGTDQHGAGQHSATENTTDVEPGLVSQDREHETAVAVTPAEETDGDYRRSGNGHGKTRNTEAQEKNTAPTLRNTQHSTPLYHPPAPGTSKTVPVTSADLKRTAIVDVPKNASWRKAKEGKPVPLILAFHGYGQDADAMSRYAELGKEGAIVVYPDGVNQSWAGAPYAKTTTAEDKKFVRDLINRIAATYRVDDHRIYAAGMSNGGGFTALLACEMPQEFAAFASVAGAYYPGVWQHCAAKGKAGQGDRPKFAAGNADSFLEIHGKADERIQYDGGERYDEHYLSPMALTGAYASRDGCFGAPETRQVTPDVLKVEWPGCRSGGEVIHLAVDDMGHTWPGEGKDAKPGESSLSAEEGRPDQMDKPNLRRPDPTRVLNASSEILAFFSRHTK